MDNAKFLKSVIETVRQPLVVLDSALNIVFANRSFHKVFQFDKDETEGNKFFELRNHFWDIAELKQLLMEIIPGNETFEDFLISREFELIGKRELLLNARKLFPPESNSEMLLLVFEDVTEQKKLEDRLRMSIIETHHQVKNSLNVVLMILSRQIQNKDSVPTEEIKKAIDHIKGYASLHQMLTIQTKQESSGSLIDIKPVFEELVKILSLGIANGKIEAQIDHLHLTSRHSSSLAVIANELITNSLKHGASNVEIHVKKMKDIVHFSITDNGKGFPVDFKTASSSGTGFNLVQSLCITDLGVPLKFQNLAGGGARVSMDFAHPKRNDENEKNYSLAMAV